MGIKLQLTCGICGVGELNESTETDNTDDSDTKKKNCQCIRSKSRNTMTLTKAPR